MLDDDGFMKIPEDISEPLPFMDNNHKKDNRIPAHFFVGDYILYYDFGQYRMQTVEVGSDLCVFRKLRWYIIDVKDDKALLLSDKCVAWDYWCGDNAFLGDSSDDVWERSDIRKFLNEVFYETAFKDEEKELIVPLNDSKDNVFILSLEELDEHFSYEDLRIGETYFADDIHGKLEVWLEPTCWWVNTVGEEENQMCVVSYDGSIDKYGREIDADETGIRPAIWVDLQGLVRLKNIRKGMFFAKKIKEEYVRVEDK